MLPVQHRVRRSGEFTDVVRRGRRIGGRLFVVHLLEITDGSPAEVRVGFVVSKGVGGSVVRNRVARRLRAQVARRLPVFPASCAVVVRALPAAATASSVELGAALDRALRRLTPVSAPR